MGEVPWKGGEGFLPSQSLRDSSPNTGAKTLIRHGFAVTPIHYCAIATGNW